jgi:hypothetical protein
MGKAHDAAAPATFARTLLLALQGALSGWHPCDGSQMTKTLASVRAGNSYAKQAQAAVRAAASGSEQQRRQLSRQMASMVSSCLKSFAASAVLQAERQQQGSKQTQGAHWIATTGQCVAGLTQPLQTAEGSHWAEIEAVAVAAALCCNLGTLLSQQTPDQPARSSSSSSSNGSTIGVASAAGPDMEWIVLAATCMLHLSTWLQQQPITAISAAAFSTYTGAVHASAKAQTRASSDWAQCNVALLLELFQDAEQGGCQVDVEHPSSLDVLLRIAVRTVQWLSRQLLTAGSSMAGSSAVNDAAASVELHALSAQADARGRSLERTALMLQLFVRKHRNSCAAGSGRLQSMQQRLQDCWQQLQGLATRVLDACPVSSCCGNPSCLNMATLSDWQLVGGKRCVCDGCGVARYCSKACQVKMWSKHHKPVCMRLRAS